MNIKPLPIGPMMTNCYIAYEHGSGFVVDPAYDAKKIYSEILKLNIKIKYIIITHAHFDHIEAVAELKNLTQAEVIVSASDCGALNDPTLNLSASFGMPLLEISADITVSDGDIITYAPFELKFIMTPGHTAGSMCILLNDKFLFAGDTLFASSIGRTDFPGGSYTEIMASLKILCQLPDETPVYPGHNEATTIGNEKMHNPFIRGAF